MKNWRAACGSALLALFLVFALPFNCPEPALSQTNEAENAEQKLATAAVSPAFSQTIRNYRSAPDATGFQVVLKSFKDFLSQPAVAHSEWSQIVQANSVLNELQTRVIDCGGGRVFTFPRAQDGGAVIVQWRETTVISPAKTIVVRTRRGRRRTTRPAVLATSSRAQILAIPSSVVVKDARIVRESIATGRGRRATVEVTRYLVLAGSDRATGHIFLSGYKPSGGGWQESADVFSGIPPFLAQNVKGRAQFQGQDLVLIVSYESPQAQGKPPSESTGYKIVLHLSGGRYAIEGKPMDEGPTAVAQQFVEALESGKVDLAKGWLADAHLISIPRYAGLIGPTRKPGQTYKLIAMANPLYGGARYRLVTFNKDDLILEVGKIKTQWAVKGIFVAPPDPLAQNLVNTLPIVPRAVEDKEESESQDKGAESNLPRIRQ